MAMAQKEKPVEIPKDVLDAARSVERSLDGKEKLTHVHPDTVKQLADHSPTLAAIHVAVNRDKYDQNTVDYVKGKLNAPDEKEIAEHLE